MKIFLLAISSIVAIAGLYLYNRYESKKIAEEFSKKKTREKVQKIKSKIKEKKASK